MCQVPDWLQIFVNNLGLKSSHHLKPCRIGQVLSGKKSYRADLLGHLMTTCQNSYEADLLSRPCHLNSKSIKWPPLVITIEQNPKAGPCHLAVTFSQWPPTHNNIYRAGPQSRSLPLQVSVL